MTERLRLSFNRSVIVEADDSPLTENAGAALLRNLDERLGNFSGALAEALDDPRDTERCAFEYATLFRARTFAMALGHPAQDDLDRLRDDPSFALAATGKRGAKAIEQALPSQPTASRMMEALSTPRNRRVLRQAPLELAIRALPYRRRNRFKSVTLDLDSSDIETHGKQEGAKYNGYYKHTCYHPLIAMIDETGDLAGMWLRRGNASSARGAVEFALPLIERIEEGIANVANVRGDAAFAIPRLMEILERKHIRYTFRLKSNPVLEELAKPFLKRPPGRPPKEKREWYYELEYQAESWPWPRRVVLVVVDDPAERYLGQPMLRHFFLVTNHPFERKSGRALAGHYRRRGTFEAWIGEFKQELTPRLSSPKMRVNQVTLSLLALAYQYLHIARVLTDEAQRRKQRTTLGTYRHQLLNLAARFTRSGRYARMKLTKRSMALWTGLFTLLERRAQRLAAWLNNLAPHPSWQPGGT